MGWMDRLFGWKAEREESGVLQTSFTNVKADVTQVRTDVEQVNAHIADVVHQVSVVNNQVSEVNTSINGQVKHIFDWLKHLHVQQQYNIQLIHDQQSRLHVQENACIRLEKSIQDLPKKQDFHALTEEISKFDKIREKIVAMEDRVSALAVIEDRRQRQLQQQQIEALHPVENKSESQNHFVNLQEEFAKTQRELNDRLVAKLDELQSRLGERRAPQSALKEKVMARVSRNSKEYVKGILKQMVEKYGKLNGLQLREMVIDEQGLSTRSTFYRLLGELEAEGQIAVVRQGKEKVFMPKSMVHENQL